jgi:curved DNA-binding protein CbpA
MSSNSPKVVVRLEILQQAEKLIKKEKGQCVLEGLELLLNSNLVGEQIAEVAESDKKNADDFISLGIDWLAKYPHAALGVAMNADIPTVRKAFKKKALKYHPDKNASTKMIFQAISSACDALCSGTSSNQGQNYEQSFEQYRDEFIRRKQEEERRKQQEELMKQEEEQRRQKKAQREAEERAQNALDEEEEEMNWRSQRARQKHNHGKSSHIEQGSNTESADNTAKAEHLPSVGEQQQRKNSGFTSGLPHSNMTPKEEIQWRKLQRQYEQLLSKVARHEERFEKEMDKQRKMFGKPGGGGNGESSLPYLHKKKDRTTSAIKGKAAGEGTGGKSSSSSQPPPSKPTSAPHTRPHPPRSNSAINSSQHNREKMPPEPPARPKTERSQNYRKSQSMPDNPRPTVPPEIPVAGKTESQSSTFTSGAADLRKKYNHLFSQNAYSKHSKKKKSSANSDQCMPTGDLSDRGNIVYNFIY